MRGRDTIIMAGTSILTMCACGSQTPEVTQEPLPVAAAPDAAAPGEKSPPPKSCPYDGAPIDVTGFEKCLDGGRCVPAPLIPEEERSRLAKCEGGYCVPEKILANAGNLVPKSCASLAGGEGRCTSMVFPDIEKAKDSLPRDACDANERCAPCYDPIKGTLTGACASVTCDSPKLPKVVFGTCCTKGGTPRGRCLPKDVVPKDEQSGLEVHGCKADKELCIPSDALEDGWVPPKCDATALTGAYTGVCISECVARSVLAQIGTARGTCGAAYFCAPCKNPLDGKPTGAPGCP